MRLSLRMMSNSSVEGAELTVAVGHEGAHAERLGQHSGLVVVGFRLLDLAAVRTRGDLAEEPERPRLVPAFFVGAGEVDGLPGEPAGIGEASHPKVALAEPGTPEGLAGSDPQSRGLLERRLEERRALGAAPVERVRVAQRCAERGDPEREVPAAA